MSGGAPDDEGLPELRLNDAEAELDVLLADLQAAVLTHPVAAQALYTALVAEGRRVAATPEGQQLRAGLAGSALARRGREAWEVGSLNALQPDAEGPFPAEFGDLLFAAALSGRPFLGRAFGG